MLPYAVKKNKKYIFFLVLLAVTFFTLSESDVIEANPENGTVAAGNATISTPASNTTLITQSSEKAIIDWRSFNIGANETTQFIQPSSISITLNRIDAAQGASSILGKLTANGQIWLINPAGILFGSSAQVDVAGLMATTANISNENFMAGQYKFAQQAGITGSIINQGSITVGDKGLVAFVASDSVINSGNIKAGDAGMVAMIAPWVQNNGVINANLGQVRLESSTEPIIDFYGDHLISFDANGAASQPTKTGISNSGSIIADGGKVMLTANSAKHVVDNVINMTGYIQANRVEQRNGEIILGGGPATTAKVSGQIQASGGTVKVSAKKVELTDNASINVSSNTGGGTILIGGNAHGAGPEPNADYVFAGSGVNLYADALTNGNGGKVVVWSNLGTQFYGGISARGGALGGNGGWIETSGKQYLDVNGARIDTRAPYGRGTWLLDPTNIYIASSLANATAAGMSGDNMSADAGPTPYAASGAFQDSLLLTSTLTTALNSTNVEVTTTNDSATAAGNITIVNPVAWTSANTLTLTAANNIAINAVVTTGATGSALILNAAGNVTQAAAGIIGGSGSLLQQGSGTTILNRTNTYTGGTFFTGGTLSVTTLAATGVNSNIGTGALSIDNGGIFSYTGANVSTDRAITIGGGGGTIQIINTATRTLTLTGGISNNGALTFDTSGTGTTNITVSTAGISGTGSITKTGTSTSGVLTFGAANSYTGATTVNQGSLRLTHASGLGSGATQSSSTMVASGAALNMNFSTATLGNKNPIYLSGSGIGGIGALIASSSTDTLTNNIVLGADTTIGGGSSMVLSGNISGPFGLVKAGTGTLTLSGLNTYSGKTTISAGTVNINSLANADGTSSSLGAPTTTSNGTIDLAGTLNYTGTGHTTDRNINLTGASTISVSSAGALTLNGVISGGSALAKSGSGTLVLSGLNTYTGGTTISAGTLSINSLADSGINSALGAGAISLGAATLTYTGSGHSSNRAIDLTANATLNASGSGLLTLSGGINATNRNLTLTGTGSALESGVIGTGTGTLAKSGTGTWTLGGANTYSGLTTVSAGTLEVSNIEGLGSTGSGTSISSGATLQINNVAIGNEAISLNNGGILLGTGANAELFGNITLGGSAANRTISTSSTGDVLTLHGTVEGAAALTLSGTGNVIFQNTIGNAAPLTSITSSSGSTTTINSGVVKTTGSQTYNGILALGADTTFTVSAANADILMPNALNNITHTITYATSGAGTIRDISLGNSYNSAVIPTLPSGLRNLTLNFSNTAIDLPALTLTGTLNVTAGGDITQSGALAVTGVTTLNSGIHNITLTNTANNFSTIGFSDGNNVTINDLNAVVLGASTITGTLDVTAGGAITQSGSALTGNALIPKTLNNTASNITLNTFSNEFNTIDLQTLNAAGTTAVAGAINYKDASAIQINRLNTSSGALTITTTGAITQGVGAGTGINTTGTSTFSAGSSNDISLINAANDFGTIAITSGKNVTITDPTAVVLGTSTISGDFSVTAGGNITQSGSTILTVTGTPTFTVTATGSDVLLGNANVFNTAPVYTDNGNIRNITLRNTALTASIPVFPTSGLQNLNLTFNNSDMIFTSAPNLTGTLTVNTGGTFGVADGVTLATNNTAINITAVDFNLNTTGALSSGTATTTITQNTSAGSLGLGTTGTMTISPSEFQRISSGNLSLVAPTDGKVLVGNLVATDMRNVTGTIILTATAGTLGSTDISGSAIFGRPLTLNTDNTVTVSDRARLETNNFALSITAKDLDLSTSGGLNSGTGALTITQNTAGGSIGLGTTGTMTISGDELQRMTAGTLSLVAPSNGSILIEGITAANTGNISGMTTLTATAGTTGSITFQNSSSTFVHGLTATTDTALTVQDGVTLATGNANLSIIALNLDMGSTGALNSGGDITIRGTSGAVYAGGTPAGNMYLSSSMLQRMTANNLTIANTGATAINVDGLVLADTANIANTVTFDAANATGGIVTFQNNPSTFKSLSVMSQDSININTPVVTTVGDLTLTSAVNLNANLTAAGAQTYNGPVTLGSNVTLNSTGGGSMNFPNAITGAFDLTLNNASSVTGSVNVNSLSLNTGSGNLTGTINGLSGFNAARAVRVLNAAAAGQLFFNGYDLALLNQPPTINIVLQNPNVVFMADSMYGSKGNNYTINTCSGDGGSSGGQNGCGGSIIVDFLP